MFDHVGIAVSEFAGSARFYRTVLSVLGAEPSHADDEIVEWEDWDIMPADRERPVTRGLHVGFRASSHEAVDAFWQAGIDAGGRPAASGGRPRGRGPPAAGRAPAPAAGATGRPAPAGPRPRFTAAVSGAPRPATARWPCFGGAAPPPPRAASTICGPAPAPPP